MKKVIDTTLVEYTKDILLQCEKEKIKLTAEDFRQSYYDDICNAIKDNIDISERVYNSIPDLQYWIEKHYLKHGKNVIVSDLQNYEVIEIKAQ